MADLEKVIKALECCQMVYECKPYEKCPYSKGLECGDCDINRLHYDAITLLKEQEAKPMTEYDDGWDCPRCGLKLVGKTASGYPCDELDLPNDEIVKYCPVCGQAVKWDD